MSNITNHKDKHFLLKISFVFISFFLFLNLSAQNGKELFTANCTACHFANSTKLVGPGLAGITDKRKREWLINFVKDSQKMVKAGDADAVAIFNEFKIPMQSYAGTLSDKEIGAIFDYLANPEGTAAVKTDDAAKEKSGASADAIAQGKKIFTTNCTACHFANSTKLVGPGLAGITDKRKREWLINFVKDSQKMVKAGDADAVAIFNEFKIPMQSYAGTLSDKEIGAIFDYLANPEGTAVAKADGATEGNASDDGWLTAKGEKEALPENIANGKLLFTGKKEFVNGAPNCVSCHNLNVIDTINWNPSAYALATTYTRVRGFNMAKMLHSPSSSKMKDLLENHELTEHEVFDIKAFLHQISKTGLIPQKSKSKILWYVILTIICFLALIDLLFIGTVNKKITALVFVVGMVFVAKAVYYEGSHIGITQYYQPEQPIKFSHKIHVGENKIQCMYCHYSPKYSKIAGIPSADLCMNCHNEIKSGKNSGTFEINKIYEALKTGKPIKWVKVHNLPDYVFYSHAQHVGAGKLQCKTCHGKIEEMDQVKQVSSLTMGWCLGCHRSHKVDFKNKYYDSYKTLHQDLKSGKKDFITVKDIGGEDCQKCHY